MAIPKVFVPEAENINIEDVRKQFPVFSQPENQGLIYFDSAATSQRPQMVLDAWNKFNTHYNANAHRGAYRMAELATLEYEKARSKVSDFIGASSEEEIVFLRGATEAFNLIAYGWALKHVGKGDEIVVSELEHHSNLIPWQMVAQKTGAELKFIPFNGDGQLIFTDYEKLLSNKTRLVAITQMSNVMGSPIPVTKFIKAAHNVGAVVVVDGSQSIPHFSINVSEMDADFFAFSGHKMLGPMGTGVLYAKQKHLEDMDPMMFGGSMIEDVDYLKSTWNQVPWKFEAGTQNIPGVIGLGAAIDYLNTLGLKNIKQHDKSLTAYALEQMQLIKGLQIYGSIVERGPVIAFGLDNVHPHDLSTFLDNKNIAVRSGHHCAKLIMKRLAVNATARASFYLYNSKNEIDAFIKALDQAKEYFSKWN